MIETRSPQVTPRIRDFAEALTPSVVRESPSVVADVLRGEADRDDEPVRTYSF
jgi:hypothetical protein